MVTGLVYAVLEILQKNSMWIIGILTGAACAFSFGVQHAWASMGLNIYYMVMSVIGLYQWKKDSGKVEAGEIHLGRLNAGVVALSAVLMVAGTAAFYFILKQTGDSAPMLDAAATVLSIIATWWLTKSYPQQWLLWIVADIITVSLCIALEQYLLAFLYFAYICSAVYGYFHWKRKGKVVTSEQ